MPAAIAVASRYGPRDRRPVGRKARTGRSGDSETMPSHGMAQPQIAHVAFGFALVAAARSGHRFAQIGAENVMIDVVATQRSGASPPLQVAPELRSDVVGVVVIGRCTACPFITVEILAVARRGPQREAPGLPEPPQRRRRCGGALPLVGIVGRIETVGAEAAVLPAGLEIEESEPPRLVSYNLL